MRRRKGHQEESPVGADVRLNALAPGEAARVVEVEGEGAFRRRLLDMGFVGGAFVRVIRDAPLRNPTEYCVGGSHVTLRSTEASRVIVKPLGAIPRGGRHCGRGLGRAHRGRRPSSRVKGMPWKKADEES